MNMIIGNGEITMISSKTAKASYLFKTRTTDAMYPHLVTGTLEASNFNVYSVH